MPQYAPPPVPQASAPAAASTKAPLNWVLIGIVGLLVFILGVVTAALVLKH